MMAATASRAAWLGPSGFSLAAIVTPSLEYGRRAAAASMGSVTMWQAAAADAAAERCRNERREKKDRRVSVGMGTSKVSSSTHEDNRLRLFGFAWKGLPLIFGRQRFNWLP